MGLYRIKRTPFCNWQMSKRCFEKIGVATKESLRKHFTVSEVVDSHVRKTGGAGGRGRRQIALGRAEREPKKKCISILQTIYWGLRTLKFWTLRVTRAQRQPEAKSLYKKDARQGRNDVANVPERYDPQANNMGAFREGGKQTVGLEYRPMKRPSPPRQKSSPGNRSCQIALKYQLSQRAHDDRGSAGFHLGRRER